MQSPSADQALTLLDWKRQVFSLYDEVRASQDPVTAWTSWRAARDRLFSEHPQSPLPEESRRAFGGLEYYEYDEDLRVLAEIAGVEPERREIGTSDGSAYAFERFAVARFELSGEPLTLECYWLLGYGGGIFLPFRDATAGTSTYGAGRYVLDTVKGADLGVQDGRLVLDFNFAYNPSCAYDPRWVCPLAPPANRLSVAIEGGEKAPEERVGGPL